MKGIIIVALIVAGIIIVSNMRLMLLDDVGTGVETNFPGYNVELPELEQDEPKSNLIVLSNSCNVDSDCSWQITNCCTENAGGNWECINPDESKIECNELAICPQVISPKPTSECLCNSGSCRG